MTISARHEMSALVKNQNARILSRVGFATEEMKSFQFEVYNEIRDRGREIGNENAECILAAHSELETAAMEGGLAVMNVASAWMSHMELLSKELFFHEVDDLDFLISLFEIAPFEIFAQFNSVTEIEPIILSLVFDVIIIGGFFEYIVDDVMVEMILFDRFVNIMNEDAFAELNAGSDYFKFNSKLIRNLLDVCTE